MLSMLDDYVKHIKSLGNKSLIARIYGIFSIKTNQFATLDVMIMQNTCLLTGTKQYTFDLKGSLIGRKVPFSNNISKKVLKDVNFLELNKSQKLVRISFLKFYELQRVIKSDSEFLLKHGIMDYSLLLVIEQNPQMAISVSRSFGPTMKFSGDTSVTTAQNNRNRVVSADKTQTYHIGIIDFLQLWDWNKYGEAKAKSILQRKNP